MRRARRPGGKWVKVLLFALVVGALYGGYFWGQQHRPVPERERLLNALPAPRALQPFALEDQFGDPFTEASLAGHWSLLFPGYSRGGETRTLLDLASRVYNRLAPDPGLQRRFRAVLLTVDPGHDTPAALEAFMERYNEAFVALTGPPREIDRLASQFDARYRARLDPETGERVLDHSTGMALVDPKGALRGLFTGVVDPAGIAETIRQLSNE